MPKLVSLLLLTAGAAALQACASYEDTAHYGMQVAPGIYLNHDEMAACANLNLAEVEAAIAQGRSLAAIRPMLGAGGMTFRGPGPGTVHVYKVHDTATGQDRIVTLHVEGDVIVDYRIG